MGIQVGAGPGHDRKPGKMTADRTDQPLNSGGIVNGDKQDAGAGGAG
jgi:hypothetical protein